jgi:hypothetical protein
MFVDKVLRGPRLIDIGSGIDESDVVLIPMSIEVPPHRIGTGSGLEEGVDLDHSSSHLGSKLSGASHKTTEGHRESKGNAEFTSSFFAEVELNVRPVRPALRLKGTKTVRLILIVKRVEHKLKQPLLERVRRCLETEGDGATDALKSIQLLGKDSLVEKRFRNLREE